MNAPRVVRQISGPFVVVSVVTLVLFWWLWRLHRYGAAWAVLYVSPAPCPPGLPC